MANRRHHHGPQWITVERLVQSLVLLARAAAELLAALHVR
jgi:hypothetical protein